MKNLDEQWGKDCSSGIIVLCEYVPEIYTDEQGLFAYSENCTPDFEKDTLQVHFSDMYQIYAPDSLKVPFAEMKIDTIETGIYGCTCNVDMQLRLP